MAPKRTTTRAGSTKSARRQDERRGARKKRMTGEERRSQILDIAVTTFGRHGFKGATSKVLAQAAGISEATIFKHFPTKSDLYAAALQRNTRVGTQHLIAELEDWMNREDDEGLVRCVFRSIFQGFEMDRDLQRMLLYAYLEQSESENNRLASEIGKYPLFDFLRRYVTQRQSEGVFGPGEPGIITSALVGLPVHYASHAKLYGIKTEHTDEQVIDTLSRVFCDGLRARTEN